MASHVASLASVYLASAKMSAIYLYFMLYQEVVVEPTLKIAPDVILLFDGVSTQSTSVKT